MTFSNPNIEQGIHIDAFSRLFDEAPFELINGERIPLMPGVASHGKTIRAIMRLLDNFVHDNALGQVFTEMPFVLVEKTDWVTGSRVPDVMFFSKARFDAYTASDSDWETKPFILIPDLAVEVVSPNDKFSDVTKKAEKYLEDGVQLVWVVDPQQKQVIVYQQGEKILLKLSESDTISGGDVIPKFTASIADFFKL